MRTPSFLLFSTLVAVGLAAAGCKTGYDFGSNTTSAGTGACSCGDDCGAAGEGGATLVGEGGASLVTSTTTWIGGGGASMGGAGGSASEGGASMGGFGGGH